jgi:HptB-dependent secretion and biofilm anti anti-sigma factor
MYITTNISEDGNTLVIKIQGKFDFNLLNPFRKAYEKPQPKPKTFIVDFEKVDYFDSSALGMLVALRAYADEDTPDVRVINCSRDIKRGLEFSKINELIKVE